MKGSHTSLSGKNEVYIGPGNNVGERAFLGVDITRNATVRAHGVLETWKLSRSDFEKHVTNLQEYLHKLNEVLANEKL